MTQPTMAETEEVAAIVRAAWSILERTGFEGFKVQGVLRTAGISARAFYRHFSGKDHLLAALELDEHQRAASRIRHIVPADGDPAVRVTRFVTAMIDLRDDPILAARIRLFSSSPVQVDEDFVADVTAATALVCAPLRAALIDGKQSGVFPSCEPDRDTMLIYWIASGAMSAVAHRRTQKSSTEAATETAQFVLRALTSHGLP